MGYFVYILECGDGLFYTGLTWNLRKRLKEHTSGKSVFTKGKLPVKLRYFEIHSSRIEAAKREHEIKGWGRRKKLLLINKSISSLHRTNVRWGS